MQRRETRGPRYSANIVFVRALGANRQGVVFIFFVQKYFTFYRLAENDFRVTLCSVVSYAK